MLSVALPNKPLIAQAVDAYEFRPATVADIKSLVILYEDFFNESALPSRGLTYDPQRMWSWLYNGIGSSDIPHLIARERSVGSPLVGAACYTMNHTFTTEPFADLNKCFVRRGWRRSAVGRILVMLLLELARADGAVLFQAGISSGMQELASFKNLLLKLGFEETDATLLIRRF